MASVPGPADRVSVPAQPRRRWRPTGAQVRLLVVALLLAWVALGITIAVSPGVSAEARWNVLLAVVLLGILAAVLRPILAAFAARLGWLAVFAAWLLGQAILVYVALSITPGIQVSGFWAAFWASWLYAVLASIALWIVTAGDQSVVVAHLLRITRRQRAAATRTTRPGVVMIQIDGLSAPLVRWGVRSGNLPTLTRWIRSGSHAIVEWHAQVPATTPASQAGLLHGASRQVPAFRWYEKESGRLVVTNHPKDSAFVEQRLSDGRGLLADGGVGLSNVFSGDAPTSMLTMSTVGAGRGRPKPTGGISAYLVEPFGLTRSLVLTIGEMAKEVYQARRQRVRGIEPRIHRAGSYVVLRGVTNVLLRHLNLTLVADHMMRGAPAIYCDFVDYDEIAHHAGPTRPEALASLDGIDRVLGILEQVAAAAPRPYRFVVLSDHGQSQGATFLQRYGLRLEDLVRQLMVADEMVTASGEDEQWGRVGTFLTELGGEQTVAGSVGRRALRHRAGGPGGRSAPASADATQRPELVVVASGNLGLVYFARRPGRVTLEDLDARYPRLLPGLTSHPGIGFVMVRSREHGPVVLGPRGIHYLGEKRVEGADPLAPFGEHAVADLVRHDTLPHVGDLVVNSMLDGDTDEVAAFEELVGCHGGLGGWQNRPVLIHPADWPTDLPLDGADAVHRQLVGWLEMIGQRASLPSPVPLRATPASVRPGLSGDQ